MATVRTTGTAMAADKPASLSARGSKPWLLLLTGLIRWASFGVALVVMRQDDGSLNTCSYPVGVGGTTTVIYSSLWGGASAAGFVVLLRDDGLLSS